MDALQNRGSDELLNRLLNDFAIAAGKYKLRGSRFFGTKLDAFVYIAVGMTGDGDRFFPSGNGSFTQSIMIEP